MCLSKGRTFLMKKTSFIFLSIILIFTMVVSGCASRYQDMTTHKSAKYVLNEDGTYKIERNLLYFRDPPDTLIIPEQYLDIPVTLMGGNFSDFNIIDVIGSKNLERIEKDTFGYFSDISHMDLKRVIFPKDGNLKSIGSNSFFHCHKLELFVVPKDFESFGYGCFYACDNLSSLVIYNETPPSGSSGLFADWWNDGFYNSPNVEFTVYVPDNAIDTYLQSEWRNRNIKRISEIENSYIGIFEDINNSKIQEQINEKNLEITLITFICIGGVLLIIFAIVVGVDLRNKKIVSKYSKKIHKLLETNQQFSFRQIQTRYSYHKECSSKRQFDNLSMDNYFISIIKNNEYIFRSLIDSINFNSAQYDLYLNKYNNINSEITEVDCVQIKFSKDKFKKYEDKVFKSKKLKKPKSDIVIKCRVTYTSPKGRNSYWKEQKYNYYDLIRLIRF